MTVTEHRVRAGRVYYEARINDDGLCRFGWSTQAGSLDLGTDRNGFGFGGTAKKSNDRRFDAYGETFGKGTPVNDESMLR
jgi:ATP-dependent RNA helicase DDX1